MNKDSYIHTLVLSACLAALAGCATAPISVTAKSEQKMGHSDNNDTSDSIILSKLASLKPGEILNVGSMTIKAGEIYTAASSSLCRSVSVGGSRRVACNDGQTWFFSEDVFLAGSARD